MDRKAGTVHALGDSLGTVPVLLRKIRYVVRFLIPGPEPRRSWLAMTFLGMFIAGGSAGVATCLDSPNDPSVHSIPKQVATSGRN